MRPDKDSIIELQDHGFEHITDWEKRRDRIKPASLEWEEQSGWIYAFATDNRVRYVGITTMVLRSRLDGYSYQIKDRVGNLIAESIGAGATCRIFGLRRGGAGEAELEEEEQELIALLGADWNVR